MTLAKRVLIFAILATAVTWVGYSTTRASALGAGVDMFLTVELQVPRNQQKIAGEIYETVLHTLQFRMTRANISGIDFDMDMKGTIAFKARNVANPELMMRYLTRRGNWVLNSENGKPVFQYKYVNKTVMDFNGPTPSVVVVLNKALEGQAKGLNNGESIPVTFVWDGEEIPMLLTAAGDGKAARLSSPAFTETLAWQIRAALTLAPYPCEMKVTDFRYGEDILKKLFG